MFVLALTAAWAVDLQTAVTAWEHIESGAGANDGDDRAGGLALAPSGDLIVAGWLDGLAGHGHDAVVFSLNPRGDELWRSVFDSGEEGSAVMVSDDRWHSVATSAAGDIALCGSVGSAARELDWTVGWYTPALAVEQWRIPYDGGLNSPTQSCRAVAVDPSRGVVSAGVVDQSDIIAGQWQIFRQTLAFGIYDLTYTLDVGSSAATPDEPTSVAVDPGGNIIVGGILGIQGAAGSNLNDTDGRVVKLDRTGRLIWSDDLFSGSFPSLEDRFASVAVSPLTNDVVGVGWVNVGSNNGPQRDQDGVARAWDPVGYLGDGARRWPSDLVIGGAGDQALTAVAFDASGQLFAAGRDEVPGGVQWFVLQIDPVTGAELARFAGPVHEDGEPVALVLSDDLFAVAGWVDDGAGPDLYVFAIGADTDGDGTADVRDGCVDDDDKTEPGVCGCDVPDVDTDADGLLNCLDGCPGDFAKSEPGECGCGIGDDDSDDDGTPDCDDLCDTDPGKDAPGICGCGTSDEDVDGDGYVTCRDECPDSSPGAVVDAVGCEDDSPATGDTGDDGSTGELPKSGCGCASAGGTAGMAALLVMPIAMIRRRRSA
jgi:MYXO-CTERM domain-containing protein